MKKISLLVFFISQVYFAQQSFLTDSNLPIVVIETDINPETNLQYEIIDEPKVPATMKIIYRVDEGRNYLTDISNDAHLNYNGKIGIEFRGSSSQELPKNPYGFTTLKTDGSNNNVSILGMPKENDWVLNSLAFDSSMIRDYLSYHLASQLGNYNPKIKYVEVVVNGDYKGVYILMEKIKIDTNRVNIIKLSNTDNTSPAITGGYIIKADKTTGGDQVAWTMPSYTSWDVDFLHDSPKTENITSEQANYIKSVFFELSRTISLSNQNITDGYPSIIDIPTFVDFIIMSELSSNVDSYQFSTFFHKDRNGKLRAGPIWDYNLTFGNDLFQWGYDRSHYNVWQLDNGDNIGAKFFKDLFNDSVFRCYLAKRWFQLTANEQPLNYTTINEKIDELQTILTESQLREQLRWNTVSLQKENIIAMKAWIQQRISWINSAIGSDANCSNVKVPNLVISKINYNPKKVGDLTSDDLEFIEITNNSNQNVDLSGFYIRELGISYQFPPGSIINSHQKIYLCSNNIAFSNFYEVQHFGEFTRNLSNSSYNIILSDAFGNTIDQVMYSDTDPWPTSADGDGSYLELSDINSDNSLAKNWIASSKTLSNKNSAPLYIGTMVYPNPTNNFLTILNTTASIKKIIIYDLSGRVIQTNNTQLINKVKLDLSNFLYGVYTIKIIFKNDTFVTKKIIKK
jgi:hypothetical protein